MYFVTLAFTKFGIYMSTLHMTLYIYNIASILKYTYTHIHTLNIGIQIQVSL